jgi:small-conductance mechanosensitive channel
MEILQDFFGDATWENIITTCLHVTMVLVLAWVAMKIVRMFVGRLEKSLLSQSAVAGEPPSESQKRVETLTRLIKQGLMLALWITASLVILQEMGVEVGPIMASAGVAGVALGFGAQNLVRDVISGFFIILENQIRVGDVAVINDVGGLVEKINFRTTVLRDSAGTVYVFPNGAINKLANMTNEWSAYVFNLRVSYKNDTDKAVEVIREVGRQMLSEEKFQRMMLGEPEIFGIDALADSAIVIQGRLKTKPILQWDVGREFLRRIKLAFAECGIEIPFPHQSVHFSADENFPPLRLLRSKEPEGETAEKPADSATAQPPPLPKEAPPAQTDNEFSEKEAREVKPKAPNKPPPDSAASE